MKFKTKALFGTATLSIITACGLCFPNLLTQLENNNQRLECSQWEPSIRHIFNYDGQGNVEYWQVGNTPPDFLHDKIHLTVASSSVDINTGKTNFILSNGATGTVSHTPNACIPDGTNELWDYSAEFTAWSSAPSVMPMPRTSCCKIVNN